MYFVSALKRAFVLLTLFATAPALAAEVQILETLTIPMSRYGQKWLSVYSKLRVKNLAFEKDIELQFTDKQGQLTPAKASYVGPSSEDHEIWESYATLKLDPTHALNAAEDYRLSVSYHSAAGDFALPESEITLKTGPVLYSEEKVQIAMPTADIGARGFPLTVVLANLAYSKNVLVHYSCDQFVSEKIQNLSFQPYFTYGYGMVLSPTSAGFELWSTWIDSDCKTLSYYVSYEVSGQKYQDGSAEFPYHSQSAL